VRTSLPGVRCRRGPPSLRVFFLRCGAPRRASGSSFSMAPQAGIVDSGRSPPRLARPGGHAAAAAAANSLVVNRVETNRHNGLHSLPKGSARILGRAEFFYIIFAILRKYTTVQEEYSRRGPRRSAAVSYGGCRHGGAKPVCGMVFGCGRCRRWGGM
jgi:hypothetical protein